MSATILEQSPNWDAAIDATSPIQTPVVGFDEGFPVDPLGKRYRVLTNDGTHHRNVTVWYVWYGVDNATRGWIGVTGKLIKYTKVVAWKEEESDPKREKSPNWDNRRSLVGSFIWDGQPLNEGFPRQYIGPTYILITRDGKVHYCLVDPDRQYAAEGLQWRETDTLKIIDSDFVVCWIER